MGDNAVHGRGKRLFAPTTPTAPTIPTGRVRISVTIENGWFHCARFQNWRYQMGAVKQKFLHRLATQLL